MKTPVFLILNFMFLQSALFSQTPVLTLSKAHSDNIYAAHFSKDSKFFLTASGDALIKIWDVESGKEIRTLHGHNKAVTSACFSPDGKYIISGASDGEVKIWETISGKEIKMLKDYTETGDVSVDWSPDGKYYATGSYYEKKIHIYDFVAGNSVIKLKTGGRISDICFSPDSKNLISTANDDVELFEIATGKTLRKFKGHKYYVQTLAFSHDGQKIISGGDDETVKIWETSTGALLRNINTGKNSGYNHVAFMPDGRHFFYGNDKGTYKCDVIDTTYVDTFKEAGNISALAVSPDGKYLGTGTQRGYNELYYVESKQKRSLGGASMPAFYSSAVSPDAQWVGVNSKNGNAVIRNLSTGQINSFSIDRNATLIFSPDNSLLITFFGNYVEDRCNTVNLYDVATGKNQKSFSITTAKRVTAAALSPDNKMLAIGIEGNETLEKNRVRVIDVASGNTISVFDCQQGLEPTTCQVNVVCFSPDGKSLLVAGGKCMDYTLSLWDVATARITKTFNGLENIPNDMCFSFDGTMILSGGKDKQLVLWDAATGHRLKIFNGHTQEIEQVRMSHDNKYIVSIARNNEIKLWSVSAAKEIKSFKYNASSAGFTKDGKYLLTCNDDYAVTYWDASTGSQLLTLYTLKRNEGKSIETVAVSPDGLFDGSDKGVENLHFVQGMNIIPLAGLYEKYYTPGLTKIILGGEQLSAEPAVNKPLSLPPKVFITNPTDNSTMNTPEVSVTLEVSDEGGGIDEIRLYHNGKLLDGTARGFKELVKQGETSKKTLTVSLIPGENRLKATAFNKERIEATSKEVVVFYNEKVTGKPDMYILAVGINAYQNPKYNLNYASNDVKGFVSALNKSAAGIFNKVNISIVEDTKATRQGIVNEFESIKSKARPSDVFVFYYAGHGVMSSGSDKEKSEYYLVLFDITKMYEADDILKQKGISSKDIMDFSKNIRAQKQLFVLDACQSGGAMQSFALRGAAEEKAIAQLARSTGTYFIAASGTEQYASEVASLGHGIFTYAIIKSIEGDCKTNDGKITVNLLKSCVEEMVPELTKKYKGESQYPTGYGFGQDFPLGVIAK